MCCQVLVLIRTVKTPIVPITVLKPQHSWILIGILIVAMIWMLIMMAWLARKILGRTIMILLQLVAQLVEQQVEQLVIVRIQQTAVVLD